MASKIIYVMLTMVALNLALIIFSCSAWDSETGECAGSLVSANSDNSTIWSLAYNPTTAGGDSGFWWKLVGSGWGLLGIIGVASAAIVLVGTTILGRDITPIVYVAMSLALISSGYPAIKLFQMISASTIIGDALSRSIIAIIIASTLVIVVMFTVIDWGRGRE